MNKAVDGVLGLVVGLALLILIMVVIGGTFSVLYSALVWLNLPDMLHGVLSIAVVFASVLTGAFVGVNTLRLIDR